MTDYYEDTSAYASEGHATDCPCCAPAAAVYEEPAFFEEPAYIEEFVYEEPVYEEPSAVSEVPVYGGVEETYVEPAYVEPAYVEPVYVEPAYVSETAAFGPGDATYVEASPIVAPFVEVTPSPTVGVQELLGSTMLGGDSEPGWTLVEPGWPTVEPGWNSMSVQEVLGSATYQPDVWRSDFTMVPTDALAGGNVGTDPRLSDLFHPNFGGPQDASIMDAMIGVNINDISVREMARQAASMAVINRLL